MSRSRIYDAKILEQVSKLYSGISEVFKEFEEDLVPSREKPLYVWATEIVIRHKDGYTIGRIGMDDFLFFEITEKQFASRLVLGVFYAGVALFRRSVIVGLRGGIGHIALHL